MKHIKLYEEYSRSSFTDKCVRFYNGIKDVIGINVGDYVEEPLTTVGETRLFLNKNKRVFNIFSNAMKANSEFVKQKYQEIFGVKEELDPITGMLVTMFFIGFCFGASLGISFGRRNPRDNNEN